mmetsp:Transcript_21685/g.36925  ORF Transcript_21685/g.36925 Transcript_21685/m.36925 type:complete len:116 (+) Transcript_21685:497-844(+)
MSVPINHHQDTIHVCIYGMDRETTETNHCAQAVTWKHSPPQNNQGTYKSNRNHTSCIHAHVRTPVTFKTSNAATQVMSCTGHNDAQTNSTCMYITFKPSHFSVLIKHHMQVNGIS